MDMSKLKKTTPGQDSHRRQWILDTVRANQYDVCNLLLYLGDGAPMESSARQVLLGMHKQDRDAILQPNGILTSEQIEALK